MTDVSARDCPRFGKLFGGCKFEGRYDRRPPAEIGAFKGSIHAYERYVSAMTTETYVRDVCVTCGRTVERSK